MVYHIIFYITFAHLLNDLIQASLPAIYPLLKNNFSLSFAQIGLISLVYQVTASLLQPWIGLYTDKKPKPYLLPLGMVVTLVGIAMLAFAHSFYVLLISASFIGIGSSTFHPEASRVARMASGGKFGTAQSLFQVGGNTGSAIGPLLVAIIVLPYGQTSFVWLMLFALCAIWVLFRVSKWTVTYTQSKIVKSNAVLYARLHGKQLVQALVVISVLILTKFTYIASISNYYTFYLIHKFHISLPSAQLYLFSFLAAVAIGTFFGGPLGDKIGRRAVIWISFLGMIPFAMVLPYVNLFWTSFVAIMAGLIMSSAFSAMIVYVQEAIPGSVGMISGLMFGLMFGVSGIAAAGLGVLADTHGIEWIFHLCAYLPLLGIFTLFLPKSQKS
ncbi:MFS transporter [Acinetobacter nectaris]|uniref:MFS transporter n=1 Tax=Acinetobacter nectaris TaxID=1219382 RepID=UPI001F4306CA|nr:MFS transporter [Acinetobacter nectaris]